MVLSLKLKLSFVEMRKTYFQVESLSRVIESITCKAKYLFTLDARFYKFVNIIADFNFSRGRLQGNNNGKNEIGKYKKHKQHVKV